MDQCLNITYWKLVRTCFAVETLKPGSIEGENGLYTVAIYSRRERRAHTSDIALRAMLSSRVEKKIVAESATVLGVRTLHGTWFECL